jgi:restriction system protein
MNNEGITPRQYEAFVCNHFSDKGYKTTLTSESNDWGVDVFAEKDSGKIAIQAKMYGGSTRKVNRQMIMELFGAKAYFDCAEAVLVTDGDINIDAKQVADKLGIKIYYLPANADNFAANISKNSEETVDFDHIWSKYIIPLAGKTLVSGKGRSNTVTKVDWGGVERITSNGNPGKIEIEIFKFTVGKLISKGYISRKEIDQNYSKRASSGIVLILSQVPFFQITDNPSGLKYAE